MLLFKDGIPIPLASNSWYFIPNNPIMDGEDYVLLGGAYENEKKSN